MTDADMRPRRRPLSGPLVPGPDYGIAAQTIATRDAARDAARDASRAIVAELRKTPEPPVNRVPQEYRTMSNIGKLASGIAGVMSEVGTIKKGGYNNYHHYHYARLEDLLEAITPLMGKHGVVVIQHEAERNIVESRIAVTYEFSIIHSSGEVWPERPRFTGMSTARDSKGNWDDKCINKCHSAARKYFLLSLFQVPSGDFEEADAAPSSQQAQPRQEKRGPVPGPEKVAAAPPQDQTIPHKIVLGAGKGADVWASAYIEGISHTKTGSELKQWDDLNDSVLQMINDKHPHIYGKINAAVDQHISQFNEAPPSPSDIIGAMPDPRADPVEAMNWVAQMLLDMKTYEAAEAFWNQIVAPHEKEFDEVDWGMLMGEWDRTMLRLNPPSDEPPETA